jgi:hypothetical protein
MRDALSVCSPTVGPPFPWGPTVRIADTKQVLSAYLLARDGREHAIKLLDALTGPKLEPWTLVDAAWTSKREATVSADNRNGATTG